VKVGTCQTSDPMLWVVRAGGAKYLCSGGHALPKFSRKTSERRVVNAKSS